jgi:hypothetical protein
MRIHERIDRNLRKTAMNLMNLRKYSKKNKKMRRKKSVRKKNQLRLSSWSLQKKRNIEDCNQQATPKV